MDLSEFELIGRISAGAKRADRFETGIGDDAAVVRTRGRIVTSVDTAVAGVHFGADRPAGESARKAVAGAVSDLAAMGLGSGESEMLVALGAPPETPDAYLEGLADGVLEAAGEFGVVLAGGDVVAAPVVFLSVTVIAHVGEGVPVLERSGARPGDVVAVSGAIGGAAAGLALIQGLEVPDLSDLARELLVTCQVRPSPALTAAPALAGAGAAAMIDLSDGLLADLSHVAEASRVGIRIEGSQVPIMPGVPEVAAALGADPLAFAMTGGEDYVLALTIPESSFASADDALIAATGFELIAVGEVREVGPDGGGEAADRGVIVETETGEQRFESGGHDHFRRPGNDSR